ncbi:hypothetical protein RN001_006252 [Aquatica leii]|uniref:PHD-type domain-containing protein n=1 Tax=Aquatica leii TaxID=1421715 RepID=A0AAN7QKV9_9COLE|nr:hypothetical protein RN001_006252 [Aquatica leii]
MTSVINPVLIQSSSLRKKKSISDVELEQVAVPDSTTNVEKERNEFSLGQDVLLRHKDGCYYLGTVIAVDNNREQCLVKFGDNTQSWSNIKNLTKPNPKQEDLLLCVVCKKSAPKDSNEITVCDSCSRGYHKCCHDPKIPDDCQSEGNAWICKRCWSTESARYRKDLTNKIIKKDNTPKVGLSLNSQKQTSVPFLSFSYNIDALTWDAYHRVNFEKIYCYCGGNGEWYTQMLQCSRCRQWFHEKCVKCLRYPLYCGDRFYVFVCAVCNEGIEFLRRLELNWVELVHLMLFNLTAYNVLKYYDLDSVIIPYINDNWHALQLPPKIYNVSMYERRNNILSVLIHNRNRFKCGRELKRRTAIWGLRVRLPPPAPCIHVPSIGTINEEQLKQICQNSRKLRFLPLENAENIGSGTRMIVPVDTHMLNIMMGTVYLENVQSESESPCPSPLIDQEDFSSNCKYNMFKTEFRGGGCAKKSVPFSKISLQRKKRMLTLNNRERDKPLRKQKQKCSNKMLTARKNNDGIYRSNKRLSVDTKNSRNNESLPLTPPTSVSAPPTPPASSTSLSGTDVAADYSETSNTFTQNYSDINKSVNNKLTKSNLTRNNLSSRLESNSIELNTPCDTSGDETSSKSTLDLIIPPPKDFKGKNNPFLALLRGSNEQVKKRRSKDAITLPLPLTAVIPGRPVPKATKRQLSEKDICIGPNGEVKRRRLRRGRVNQLATFQVGVPTASKTAAVVPVRPDAKEWGQRNIRSSLTQTSPTGSQISNCVDYALNARLLRHRQEKNQEKEKSNPPTPKHSPVKQEPDIDMDDLKNSVNIYFGAANRIAAGERFFVKAKRVNPNGKLQYLMEWQGSSNGMT